MRNPKIDRSAQNHENRYKLGMFSERIVYLYAKKVSHSSKVLCLFTGSSLFEVKIQSSDEKKIEFEISEIL